MKTTTVDYFSMVSTPIDLSFNDTKLGPATGFFYEFRGRTFIVSNWHVFSGRTPYSGQPLSDHGGTPNQMNVSVHSASLDGRTYLQNIPITDDDGTPRWIQHPFGQAVDIAAFQVELVNSRLKIFPANEASRVNSTMSARIADDVFILGYPLGMKKQRSLPVWKRGTIAAEPDMEMDDGSPTYLVDTATREGMSGSIVVLRSNSGVVPSGQDSVSHFLGPQTNLLGVYSGRFGGSDNFSAQLGRVWKIKLVDEMLANPRLGSYELISL